MVLSYASSPSPVPVDAARPLADPKDHPVNNLVNTLSYFWLAATVTVVAFWLLGRIVRGRRQAPDNQEATDVSSDGSASDSDPSGEDGGESTSSSQPISSKAGARPSSDSRSTLNELLSDVMLPYDLAPAPGRIIDSDHHAVYLSPHDDPADIGTSFADALVAQGFTIEPVGRDAAFAMRHEEILSLRVTPDAASIRSGGLPRYPEAIDNQVALEVWTGQGPPPALRTDSS